MTKKEIAIKYVSLLENNEMESIIKLFSKSGKVTSPIYGTKSASIFYKKLKEDTNKSILTLKGIFEEQNSNRVAIYFNYHWTLKNNKSVIFDVVDIIEFNQNLEIEHLHIIYDTIKSRDLVSEINH